MKILTITVVSTFLLVVVIIPACSALFGKNDSQSSMEDIYLSTHNLKKMPKRCWDDLGEDRYLSWYELLDSTAVPKSSVIKCYDKNGNAHYLRKRWRDTSRLIYMGEGYVNKWKNKVPR